MKRKAAILLFLCASISAIAQNQWESAANVGQQPTGDLMLTRCSYRTIGGYSFSIVVRSSVCPFRVEVNPETGQVRH